MVGGQTRARAYEPDREEGERYGGCEGKEREEGGGKEGTREHNTERDGDDNVSRCMSLCL